MQWINRFKHKTVPIMKCQKPKKKQKISTIYNNYTKKTLGLLSTRNFFIFLTCGTYVTLFSQ